MKRGTIVTVAGGPGYAGKPRPAVILQDERLGETTSITVALLTTTEVEAPLFRLPVEPTPETGLHARPFLMVDKVTTIPHNRLGPPIGQLPPESLAPLRTALMLFLGLAD